MARRTRVLQLRIPATIQNEGPFLFGIPIPYEAFLQALTTRGTDATLVRAIRLFADPRNWQGNEEICIVVLNPQQILVLDKTKYADSDSTDPIVFLTSMESPVIRLLLRETDENNIVLVN